MDKMFRLSNSAGFKAEKVVCPNPQTGFGCPLKILVEVWVNGGTPLCCFDKCELYPLLAEDLPIHIPLIVGEVNTTNWIFFCRRSIPRNDSKVKESGEKNNDKTENRKLKINKKIRQNPLQNAVQPNHMPTVPKQRRNQKPLQQRRQNKRQKQLNVPHSKNANQCVRPLYGLSHWVV